MYIWGQVLSVFVILVLGILVASDNRLTFSDLLKIIIAVLISFLFNLSLLVSTVAWIAGVLLSTPYSKLKYGVYPWERT